MPNIETSQSVSTTWGSGKVQGSAPSMRLMKRPDVTAAQIVVVPVIIGGPITDANPSEINLRKMPDYLYVDVPTITKKISISVFLICVFSLALTIVSGFKIIHPFAAILIGAASVLFYIMGEYLKRTATPR